jgi:hypothetical protein
MVTGFVTAVGWNIIAGTHFFHPGWLSVLIPGSLGSLAKIIVSLATQKRHPPLPLFTSDGKILKFADLAKK